MTPERTPSKVWLVTGASRGFGRAICQAAADHGDTVVATAREPSGDALALDVTDPASIRAAIEAAIDRHGRLDVVVNNAGYGHVGAVEELTDDELRRLYEVNFFGVLNVTRAVLPQLRRQRSGHLVQMSSLNGIVGMPGGGHYVASKFAIEGLSESLADEVRPLGIRVTIVEPGPYRTGFLGKGMGISEPIDDYAATVGQARQALREMDGQQPGDPAEGARAIVDCVHSEDPPLRLPLGEDAVNGIRDKLEAQLRELPVPVG